MIIFPAGHTLQITWMKSLHFNRSHGGRPGGALGAHMNLFDRFARVVKVVLSIFSSIRLVIFGIHGL